MSDRTQRTCDRRKNCWEKIKNLKSKRICARKIKAKVAEIKIADIDCLVANDAEITNLNVDNITIGGQSFNACSMNVPTIHNEAAQFVPFGSTGPTGVNPIVYDCLLQNALVERDDLRDRLEAGREIIAEFLSNYPCPQTCPPGTTGPVELEIYGTKTIPLFTQFRCIVPNGPTGPTGATGTVGETLNIVPTNVTFNLDVDYQIEIAESIDPRVVSVLVQIGWIGPTGGTGPTGGCTGTTENVIIETVYIGNKQIVPTLDIEYGENFASSVLIPSDVMAIAMAAMPDPSNTGAIQVVVFKEKGVCIWSATDDGFECRQNEILLNNNSVAVSGQAVTPCVQGCMQVRGSTCVIECDE